MQNPYQAQIEELEAQLADAQELAADPDFAEMAATEITTIETQLKQMQDAALQLEQGFDNSEDVTTIEKINCTFEIRPGAGGDEAKIWANDLKRMYVRFLEVHNFKIEHIDDLIFKAKGKTTEILPPDGEKPYFTAYELFKYESGVHRVQRVPETESQGRIHTSTASIAVLPEVPVHVIEIRDEDIEWQFMRASGAGGQSVNKTNSAVRLIHKPSGIATTCRQEKKQEQNRKIAMDLLRSQLWEIEEEKREKALGKVRSAIGRAQRAEKIRTFNYPQNRVTDHRVKESWHNLPLILDGALTDMLTDLHRAFYEEEQAEITTASEEK
ncbi:MAG: PCRF domain-containing protein [Candidatus Pacebacteria bacterium]|nr:PCRF domain-containing protein [Candidatus Paceibacterota bacterium]PIR63382.1 MAG: peptide chain release factor 1 [Candidatus Pacebacteria bacterium CG10_big_fil_rev_8_21_14_0_10_40_26]PIZ79130.1 MAG: peptide chain release factor 1 [Candidatus Pacebacteria bacterium CG_4_10_14_0_2_um_filter_40_20]PJA69182.1 MAG: peptide chain release factor 1 [Candidatus Pacebacteria bacterium CG_4_9_14_3_um_filter_40_12]PJC42096.1 MAG: peptide chain release factor 1 [Candidatus Pacebacteria bacterium CG_4_